MRCKQNLRAKLRGPLDRGVEVVDFEPEQYAVSVGPDVWVPDRAVVVVHVPGMKLQDQSFAGDQALIFRPAVVTLAPQQLLIPATAGLDIGNGQQWLRPHQRNFACKPRSPGMWS